jgi:hypothetical protein
MLGNMHLNEMKRQSLVTGEYAVSAHHVVEQAVLALVCDAVCFTTASANGGVVKGVATAV